MAAVQVKLQACALCKKLSLGDLVACHAKSMWQVFGSVLGLSAGCFVQSALGGWTDVICLVLT